MAFLHLAYEELPLTDLPEHVVTEVVTFVKDWGPLWLCRTPEHSAQNQACYWAPRQGIYMSGTHTLCTWRPVEEVYAFVHEARQAKMVVKKAGQLLPAIRSASPSPTDLGAWHDLVYVVNTRLARLGQFTLQLPVMPGLRGQKPYLLGPVGFLPVVWTEIALALGHAQGLYICDACGEPYMRTGRRPKFGQHQYCEQCGYGGNNTGAGKLSNRRRRGHERQEDTTRGGGGE